MRGMKVNEKIKEMKVLTTELKKYKTYIPDLYAYISKVDKYLKNARFVRYLNKKTTLANKIYSNLKKIKQIAEKRKNFLEGRNVSPSQVSGLFRPRTKRFGVGHWGAVSSVAFTPSMSVGKKKIKGKTLLAVKKGKDVTIVDNPHKVKGFGITTSRKRFNMMNKFRR